jgi:hypothetical protein
LAAILRTETFPLGNWKGWGRRKKTVRKIEEIREESGFSFKNLPFHPHRRPEFADLELSYTAPACRRKRRSSEQRDTSLLTTKCREGSLGEAVSSQA